MKSMNQLEVKCRIVY